MLEGGAILFNRVLVARVRSRVLSHQHAPRMNSNLIILKICCRLGMNPLLAYFEDTRRFERKSGGVLEERSRQHATPCTGAAESFVPFPSQIIGVSFYPHFSSEWINKLPKSGLMFLERINSFEVMLSFKFMWRKLSQFLALPFWCWWKFVRFIQLNRLFILFLIFSVNSVITTW